MRSNQIFILHGVWTNVCFRAVLTYLLGGSQHNNNIHVYTLVAQHMIITLCI